MEKINFSVLPEEAGTRIDKFLSDKMEGYSRSYIQKLIKENHVCADGKIMKANYKVVHGDAITVLVPDAVELEVKPRKMDLNIFYEDKDFLIINKPKDMVVHPAPGNYENTLVNGILYHCKDELSGINGVLRPGIVHRIDKNTTGLLVVCKNDKAHLSIAEQLKEHSITRKYEAIVYHNLKEDEGTICKPIGRHPIHRKQMAVNEKNGRAATTHYKVLQRLKDSKFTHVQLQLETGRTHQIRVHMASIHHPLLGDDVYGPKKSPFKLNGQVLHARTLGFVHPTTKKYVEFTSELPMYFEKLLKNLSS